MSKSVISYEEWRAALTKAQETTCDVVPKGWITLKQYAVLIRVKYPAGWTRMQLLLQTGAAEMKSFRIRTAKTIREVEHYRLKK